MDHPGPRGARARARVPRKLCTPAAGRGSPPRHAALFRGEGYRGGYPFNDETQGLEAF